MPAGALAEKVKENVDDPTDERDEEFPLLKPKLLVENPKEEVGEEDEDDAVKS